MNTTNKTAANKEEKKFLSTKEAAELLNISRVAVFNKIKSGEIPAIKVGRNYIIPAENITSVYKKDLNEKDKDRLNKSVDKVLKDYGEAIKLLGNE